MNCASRNHLIAFGLIVLSLFVGMGAKIYELETRLTMFGDELNNVGCELTNVETKLHIDAEEVQP